MKRLFTILSAFTMDHYRLTIEQLSNKTRIPQSSIYRILKSFLDNGYIVKGEFGTFKLGPAILQLGRIAETGYGVREIAIPWMEWLYDKTDGATISLWVRFGDERLCIESREPRESGLKYSAQPGDKRPIYAGSAAKVLLSFIDESEAIAILKRVSLRKIAPNTIVNSKILLKQCQEIRKQGYSYSRAEVYSGVHAISAPLFNSRGCFEAALTIAAISNVDKNVMIDKYSVLLLKAAENISAQTKGRI